MPTTASTSYSTSYHSMTIIKCPCGRIRKEGGGRKKSTRPLISGMFEAITKDYVAGNPQEPNQKWTALSPKEIQEKFLLNGQKISVHIIHNLYDEFDNDIFKV
jgi:hypothetical protein